MKANSSPHHRRASTMTDVLIVVATLVLLGVVFLPVISRSKTPSKRIACVSQLKQIGLAFRIWSSDYDDHFPWMISTNGGSLAFTQSTNVFLHFRAASNELCTPYVLHCPSDAGKMRTYDFNIFDNRYLSYFVGLDADEGKLQSILSGDRNLTTNGVALGNGVFTLTTNNALGWTAAIHQQAGNILLSDGSVAQVSQATYQMQWLAVTNAVRRLAIP